MIRCKTLTISLLQPTPKRTEEKTLPLYHAQKLPPREVLPEGRGASFSRVRRRSVGGVERRIRARRGQYGFPLPAGGRGQNLRLSFAAGTDCSLVPTPPDPGALGVFNLSCIHIVDSGLRADGEVAAPGGTRAYSALPACVCVLRGRGGPGGIGILIREKPVSPGSPSFWLETFWLRLILTEFAGFAKAQTGL